jgi:hypothetical protein
MMGALKYTITVEADVEPQLYLGQNIFGGKIVQLKMEELPALVPVSWLVEKYGFTKTTIIKKLEGYNQGTDGKHLYETKTAMMILSKPQKNKRGAKRVN